jgi:hypothetical protein
MQARILSDELQLALEAETRLSSRWCIRHHHPPRVEHVASDTAAALCLFSACNSKVDETKPAEILAAGRKCPSSRFQGKRDTRRHCFDSEISVGMRLEDKARRSESDWRLAFRPRLGR